MIERIKMFANDLFKRKAHNENIRFIITSIFTIIAISFKLLLDTKKLYILLWQ